MKYRSLTHIYFKRSIYAWNIGHADLHFMTHKSMSQGLAMSDQLSALLSFHNRKVEKHFLKVS